MNTLREQYEQCVNPGVALASVITPSTTVAELRKLMTQHPTLADAPLSALRAGDIAPTRAKQASKPYTPRKNTKHVDTRTGPGRAVLDASIVAIIERDEHNIRAARIVSETGATVLQVRKSLGRLITAGSVTWSGKNRGTRYHAVE